MGGAKRLFKDELDRAAIGGIADEIAITWSGFDRDGFVGTATQGLKALGLKDRVAQIANTLHQYLPSALDEAVEILATTLERGTLRVWRAWPLIDFVGYHGVGEPSTSLAGLRRMTRAFSAEFAIRPFLLADQKRTLTTLASWLDDPDEHVRRLVSEGTRPRLPWGAQLPGLIADPSPVVPLLEALRDDPSEYVRRSVGNHLNDITKDHPAFVLALCESWATGEPATRHAVIKRALRTLVKAGNPRALAILGFRQNARLEVHNLQVSPARIRLGDSVTLTFELVSREPTPTNAVVDYAIHHPGKHGRRDAKVFKLKNVRLAELASLAIKKRHTIKPITTRRYYSGEHHVEVLVNGNVAAQASFDLKVP